MDRALQDVHQKLRKRFKKNLTFIVFSDHSQCEYAYSLNLPIMLGKKGIKLGDDYLCFIDATLALFWPKNEVTKEKILSVLHQIKLGKVLNEDLQERYHIRFRDKRYGEIIFVLKPGGTFFPNFFSPFSAMKGLHGYLPEEEVQKSFLISDQKFLYPFRHIRDFRNFSLKAACL